MKRREFINTALTGSLLLARDIHAHNSFDNPRAIEPQQSQATLKGGTLVYSFAPASVTRLQIALA